MVTLPTSPYYTYSTEKKELKEGTQPIQLPNIPWIEISRRKNKYAKGARVMALSVAERNASARA